MKGLPATKRNTLRLLAGIFDPLGIVGLVTMSAKIVFQDVCRQKITWDDPLQGEVKQGIEDWIKSLTECQRITIKGRRSRGVFTTWVCYASKKTYCAVIYLRTQPLLLATAPIIWRHPTTSQTAFRRILMKL